MEAGWGAAGCGVRGADVDEVVVAGFKAWGEPATVAFVDG